MAAFIVPMARRKMAGSIAPRGRIPFMPHIYVALAEKERALIADRTRAALAQKKVQGTKLGGYPDWVQDPEYPRCPKCKTQMEHYVTIASTEWDGMSFHRWKPVEEGLPDRAGDGHIEDARLMIGDAGNLYMFVCREHDTWPVAQVMQCS